MGPSPGSGFGYLASSQLICITLGNKGVDCNSSALDGSIRKLQELLKLDSEGDLSQSVIKVQAFGTGINFGKCYLFVSVDGFVENVERAKEENNFICRIHFWQLFRNMEDLGFQGKGRITHVISSFQIHWGNIWGIRFPKFFQSITKTGEPRQEVFTVEEYSKMFISKEGKIGPEIEVSLRYL